MLTKGEGGDRIAFAHLRDRVYHPIEQVCYFPQDASQTGAMQRQRKGTDPMKAKLPEGSKGTFENPTVQHLKLK